jgi:hypothetical protein
MRIRNAVAVLISIFVTDVCLADPVCKFAVKGGPSVSGKFTNLTLNVQVGSPQAIRFYAEPHVAWRIREQFRR